jgi:ribosomal protein S27AE
MNEEVLYPDLEMDVTEEDGEFFCPRCNGSIANNHKETCIHCGGLLNWPNYSGYRTILVIDSIIRFCPNGCSNQKDNFCSICGKPIKEKIIKRSVALFDAKIDTAIDLNGSDKCPTCGQFVGTLGGVPERCHTCGQKLKPSKHASLSFN